MDDKQPMFYDLNYSIFRVKCLQSKFCLKQGRKISDLCLKQGQGMGGPRHTSPPKNISSTPIPPAVCVNALQHWQHWLYALNAITFTGELLLKKQIRDSDTLHKKFETPTPKEAQKKTRLRDSSQKLPRFRDRIKKFPRSTIFWVPFATPS